MGSYKKKGRRKNNRAIGLKKTRKQVKQQGKKVDEQGEKTQLVGMKEENKKNDFH
jgi:hypothetical protein